MDTKSRPQHALLFVSLSLSAFGCTGDLGDEESTVDDVNVAQHALFESGEYSLGLDSPIQTDLGSSATQTCFLSGVLGNLHDRASSIGEASVSVRPNASGHYILSVHPTAGKPLRVFTRCVALTAGRTKEVDWNSSMHAASVVAQVIPNRHCFLTSISSRGGFGNATDHVKIRSNGFYYYLDGSGEVSATAQCLDFAGADPEASWQAGNPGTRHDALTGPGPFGKSCFLTTVAGMFASNSYSDGVYVSYDSTDKRFYMNTTNGKLARSICVK